MSETLTKKRCVACEGLVDTLTPDEVAQLLPEVPHWKVVENGKRIRREWKITNFLAGIDFFNKVAAVAEKECHHPDLHIVGYRNLAIEIWTHSIGGLSENDFILAAKVDAIPFTSTKSG